MANISIRSSLLVAGAATAAALSGGPSGAVASGCAMAPPANVQHRLSQLRRQPGVSDDEAYRRLMDELEPANVRTEDGLRWYFDGRFWCSEPVV